MAYAAPVGAGAAAAVAGLGAAAGGESAVRPAAGTFAAVAASSATQQAYAHTELHNTIGTPSRLYIVVRGLCFAFCRPCGIGASGDKGSDEDRGRIRTRR